MHLCCFSSISLIIFPKIIKNKNLYEFAHVVLNVIFEQNLKHIDCIYMVFHLFYYNITIILFTFIITPLWSRSCIFRLDFRIKDPAHSLHIYLCRFSPNFNNVVIYAIFNASEAFFPRFEILSSKGQKNRVLDNALSWF